MNHINNFSMLGWFLNQVANVDFSRNSDLLLLGDSDKTVEGICNKLEWKELLENIEVNNLEHIS